MVKKTIPKIQRVNNTKEVDNFYQSISTNVKKLMNDKKYNEALAILEEELSQPYLPMDYYNHFYDLKKELLLLEYDKKLEEKYWAKSQEELLKIILINPEYEYLDVFITKCEEFENTNNYLELIQMILLSKDINFNFKLHFLNGLMYLNVNKQFDLYNNNTHQVNPINIVLYEDSIDFKNYLKTSSLTQDLCNKDITIINFCLKALDYIRDYYFPKFPFKDLEALAESIYKFVTFTIFGNLDQFVESDLDELVFDILKDFNW